MDRRWVVSRVALATVGVALAVTGCGSSSKDDTPAPGTTSLTVYSSLPLTGASRAQSQSMVEAEKLALSEAGGIVGPFTVKFVSMNDATSDKGRWEPGQVIDNARKALEDRSAIAYIGEADSGASAIAIPVLNEAGLLMVSPTSTYAGLTQSQDADKGEPEKYYPSGKRTFARIVPADNLQAVAQATIQRQAGCTRLFVLGDRDVYGRGIATAVAREVTQGGAKLAGQLSLPPNLEKFDGIEKKIAKARPDCVFAGIALSDDAPKLVDAIGDAAPSARIFAPDALVDPAFAASVSPSVASRLRMTALTPTAGAVTAKARKFVSAFTERYSHAPDPDAIYGYEAMRAVLASIKAAGNQGNDRGEVVKQFLSIRDRRSVIGTYSIERDGDTTLAGYTSARIAKGRLRFGRAIAGAT